MTDNWPPAFTLRKSARAKRASIRIRLHQHVEVVIPERTRFFDPMALLNEHKDWVLKQLRKTTPLVDTTDAVFPEKIQFHGLNREICVRYQPHASSRLTLSLRENTIHLSGDANNWPKVKQRLIDWLNNEAMRELSPLLLSFAEHHGFPVKNVQIRHMKTRWGSCRRDGQITLNSQLLFLPLPLIHHVILHELCHTRYMSHGPRFWGLLQKLDPNTAHHDKALGAVQQYIPGWCF